MDNELKACCVSIAQQALNPREKFDPTSPIVTNGLEELLSILSGFEPSHISAKSAELVFFSLKALLQQEKLGTRPTELLFRCLTIICSSVWSNGEILGLERAQQLIAVTTYLLSPDPSLEKTSPTFLEKPRSFHTAAFELLAAIYRSAGYISLREPLSHSPTLVQVISLSLDVIQHDSDDLKAQLASIDCLQLVLTQIITSESHRAMVLPLVVSRLVKFVHPANKRHFRAKFTALDCLNGIIVGTLNDKSFDNPNSCKVRTFSWLETTVSKLAQSFQVLNTLQTSLLEVSGSRSELFSALYNIAHSILSTCKLLFDTKNIYGTKVSSESPIVQNSKMLHKSLINLVLLTTSQQVNVQLSSDSRDFLLANSHLLEVVKSEVYSLLAELPATLSNANETYQQFTLQSLENSIELTASADLCQPIIDAVELALPLTTRKVPEISGRIQQIESYDPMSFTRSFADLNAFGLNVISGNQPISSQSQAAVSRIFRAIGSKLNEKDATQLVESVSNKLISLRMRGKQSLDAVSLLWIAGQILPSIPADSDIHDLVTYCYDGLNDDISETKNAVVISKYSHTALCCFVIGEAAILQGSLFKEYIVDLLFPLFALLGHNQSSIVRDQASVAISKLAFACGYDSPQQLAIENKDYLVDGWSLQINSIQMTPSTLESLASLIFISGDAIIPYMDDVFASLFVLIDHYHGYSRLVRGVLANFGALVYVISQNKDAKLKLENTSRSLEVITFADVISELQRPPQIDPSIEEPQSLDDYKRFKEAQASETNAETLSNENPDTDSEIDSDDERNDFPNDVPENSTDKWEYALSKPVYLTLQKICDYCDRLMSHDSSDIRMATLTLITELVPYLAINKDLFLPTVHKIWPIVVSRSFDNEFYVVAQSLRCISAIAMNAQDFVASRVDQIWQRLMSRYSKLFLQKWPRFAPEQRICDGLTDLFNAIVQHIPDVSLAVLESGVVAFRPAFLRGDYTALQTNLANTKPSAADLLWLVLLTDRANSSRSNFHSVLPVYN